MVKDMDRSLSKFLYEFLPGNTFNHSNIQVSGRVASLSSLYRDGSKVELNAPDSYVIKRVKQQFYRWPNSDDLLDDDLYANVDIVVPGYAQYYTYPRTFECPGCGMFIKFRQEDEQNLHEKDPAELFSCDHCSASLSVADQLPFVAICECGEIRELWAPKHDHNGQALNMRLDRPTSRMSSWEWQCVHEGCNHTIPFMGTKVECPDPGCPNEDLRVTNHTDSNVFYPQNEVFINLQKDLEHIDSNTLYRAKVISDYLLEDEMQKPSESEIKEKAAELLGGYQEFVQADEEEEKRAREQAREMLTEDRQEHQQKVAAWLDNHQKYNEEKKISLAEECYEYLSLTQVKGYEPESEFRAISYDEMISSPTETHLDEATVDYYRDLRDSLNISNIHLIEDIPMTTVTYGYTRISSEAEDMAGVAVDPSEATLEPEEGHTDTEQTDVDEGDEAESEVDIDVQLNTFTTRSDPYPTFYAQEHKAEGVLVELDPEKVLDWLELNGVITSDNRPDPDKARMWFVDSVLEPGRYESLKDHEYQTHLDQGTGQAISRHVYTLINSYAHVFMNSIGVLAGLQRESLVERVMPHTLSFLVYKRPDTDQAFGTILSLFEERFDEVENQFHEQGTCPLDRVCYADENGACEHCLYLPGISTENTNHNLSRSAVFGGKFDSGKFKNSSDTIDGFLQI